MKDTLPVIINLCVVGMIPTKAMNSATPISPSEIINTTLSCAKLGASVVHIHPRDTDGKPTWKKEILAKIISGIRSKNDKILISVSTSGRLWKDFKRRSECLDLRGDLKPDLASLTLGSMNFINVESVNSPSMIESLAVKMRDRGIKPELEVFEPGMVHKAKYLISHGILADSNPYFNILLGSLGTAPLEPSNFAAFYSILPPNAVWSLAGIGNYQLDANMLGLAFGGNVRVGLEDNIYFDRNKSILASNEMLVERVAKIAKIMGRKIATPGETRKILGI